MIAEKANDYDGKQKKFSHSSLISSGANSDAKCKPSLPGFKGSLWRERFPAPDCFQKLLIQRSIRINSGNHCFYRVMAVHR